MGFLAQTKDFVGRVASKFFTINGTLAQAIDDSAGGGYNRGTRLSRSPEAWLKTLNKNGLVGSVVNRIATDVSKCEYVFNRNVGINQDGTKKQERVHSHPAIDLWNKPNYKMSGSQFRKLGVQWLEMAGRWPIYIERYTNGTLRGQIKYLWPVRPQDMVQTPTVRSPKWKFRLYNKLMVAEIQDFIWIIYVDPEDPYGWGAAPAEGVAIEVATLEYAMKWNANLFRNGANVGKIVGVPGLTSAEGKRMKSDFERDYVGIGNSHRPFFVGTDPKGTARGGITISDLSKSHRDMEFSDGIEDYGSIICQNWNMPGACVGRMGDSNRADSDNAEHFKQKNVILPRAEFLVEQFQLQFIGEFGEPDLELGVVNVVQETVEFKLRQAESGISRGGMTVNEFRQQTGKQSLGPIGDVLTMPENMLAVPTNITVEQLMEMMLKKSSSPAAPDTPKKAEVISDSVQTEPVTKAAPVDLVAFASQQVDDILAGLLAAAE